MILLCALISLHITKVRASLGPHEAEYSTSQSGILNIDLGPLGTIKEAVDFPLGIGVDVIVKEIPEELQAIEMQNTLNALSQDFASYLQFFGSVNDTVSMVQRALIIELIRNFLIALGISIAVVGVIGVLMGKGRLRQLNKTYFPRALPAMLLIANFAIVILTLAPGRIPEGQRLLESESAVFEGTAFEGAVITGRLASVIDSATDELKSQYQKNEEFYLTAEDNLQAAWSQQVLPSSARQMIYLDRSSEYSANENIVNVVLVSDLHCNTGMSHIIKTAAELSNAQIIFNAGDTTINGTTVEQVCVQSFAKAVPKGAVMVQADGNHDSTHTSDQARALGIEVLDGKVIEVAGIKILGDSDPKATRFGQGSSLAGSETPAEEAQRLAETACQEDDGVDLLLIHTPTVGTPAMESGCVAVQFSGHIHRHQGPERIGKGIRYISSTTAGAVSGQLTVGPLKGTAELSVLRFDKVNRKVLDYRIIEINPDMSVHISDREVLSVEP